MVQQQSQSLLPWVGSSQFPRFKTSNLFPMFWDDMLSELSDLGNEQTGLTLSEDKKNVYVEAALPGLQLKDIDVTLEKGILWIKGEKKEEEEDKEKKFYRKATSSFSYRLALPNQIDESKEPKANYQDGVLKMTFAKALQSQARKITVK